MAHQWQPVYERFWLKDRECVVAAVVGSGIDLILKLTDNMPEPFGILYVLIVPRKATPGRYQMRGYIDRLSLVSYLNRYREYFEGDGRHDIWVKSGDDSLVVYDRHEVLYLYGDLDRFCGVLDNLEYRSKVFRVDFAHIHHYNEEFDNDQFSIVDSDDYIHFELVAGQDYEIDDPRPH